MKFLITMNMASSSGNLVHQVILDHQARSVGELLKDLNDEIFIYGKQFYRKVLPNGESSWSDRGEIIINTSHIGKVQEFVEYYSEQSDVDTTPQRPPLRSKARA